MPRRLHALLPLTALLLAAPPASAADPEDVLTAMDVSLVDCFNVTSVAAHADQRAVVTNLGIVQNQYGGSMGLLAAARYANLHSCIDDQVSNSPMGNDPATGSPLYDLVAIEMDCVVPSYANSLGFSFYFFSREYPDYVGSAYNDAFQVFLTSQAWNGNIVFDGAGNVISVNNALFTVTNQALLAGTGFDCGYRGGGTGWLTTIAPVIPDETIHLRFEVFDMSDGIYDSAVLVDDFYWSETDPKSPTTGHPVELWFLSPKEGPLEGGQEVTVYGKNFTNDTRVYFGATQVQAVLVDSGRMRITTPQWDQLELVDVMADNSEFTDELAGAYAYVDDVDEGGLPPEFYLLEPDVGDVAGGESVRVLGENFVDGSIAYFDGVAAATEYVNVGELRATTPAHDEGVIEVLVFNPDGQFTEPTYFFTYTADAAGDDDDSAGEDDDAGDCSCDTADGLDGGAGLALLGLAGLLVARRRR